MNGQTLEEVDTIDLGTSDLACSFNHDHGAVAPAFRTCSVEVTHIGEASCGRESVFLCDNAAAAMLVFIQAGIVARCKVCHQPPATHWTVRMI